MCVAEQLNHCHLSSFHLNRAFVDYLTDDLAGLIICMLGVSGNGRN